MAASSMPRHGRSMCMPLATRAIEPNEMPPTISRIIMAPQRQTTLQARPSLAVTLAEKYALMRDRRYFSSRRSWGASFQIAADDFEQSLGRVGVEGSRVFS